MKKIIAFTALIAIVFSSCNGRYTIAKRKYNKGFYVSKSGNVTTKPAVASTKTSKISTPKEKIETEVVYSKLPSQENSAESPSVILPVKNLTKTSENNKSTSLQLNAEVNVVASNHSNYSSQTVKFKKVVLEKNNSTSEKKGGNSDAKFILCIILAIFIPPLGMFLWDKNTDLWFILDLILFILLFSWFFWGSLGLVGLAAVVIALLRVFEAI